MGTKEGRYLWGWISRSGKKAPGEVQPKRSRGAMTLWGQEFNLVKMGLDETQVVAYVEDLKNRLGGEIEELQQQRSLPELAGEVIFEAEKLGESIRDEERRRAAEHAASILLRAEERSKEIIEEAERAGVHRLKEATRLSVEVVEEARERTTLAEENTIQQLPQQLTYIQSALQAGIDQAYQKVLSDLVALEHDIQSRGAEEEPRSTEAFQTDESSAEPRSESITQQSQPTEVLQSEEPVREIMVEQAQPTVMLQLGEASVQPVAETFEDESEIPGNLATGLVPVSSEDREEAEASMEQETSSEKSESTRPGLPLNETSDFLDDAEGAEDYSNMNRDEVREKILESLQQAIELNSHLEEPTSNGVATMDEEQVYSNPNPDPEQKPRAVVEIVNALDTSGDLFEGDMEFVMNPRKEQGNAKNHLARLSALYMTVKNLPGASVLGTGGSEAEGNSISVHFESPICLSEVLKDVTMWEEDSRDSGATRSRSLLGKLKSSREMDNSQRKRILVTL